LAHCDVREFANLLTTQPLGQSIDEAARIRIAVFRERLKRALRNIGQPLRQANGRT
jgi:hypothetical protein